MDPGTSFHSGLPMFPSQQQLGPGRPEAVFPPQEKCNVIVCRKLSVRRWYPLPVRTLPAGTPEAGLRRNSRV